MRKGLKLYRIQEYRIVEYIVTEFDKHYITLFSRKTNDYKKLTILTYEKSNEYFESRIVALRHLEERLYNALINIREELDEFRADFLTKPLTE